MKTKAKALEGRQQLAGDLTGDNWPSTGQKVRERTIHENTNKKTYVHTHHSENYTLVTVLHQCRQKIWYLSATNGFKRSDTCCSFKIPVQSYLKSITDEGRHNAAIVTSAKYNNL